MNYIKFLILIIIFSNSLFSQTNSRVRSKMNDTIEKEIIELHHFFEDWFTAKLENTDENFRRFENVMAETFEIISPSGIKTCRKDLVNNLKNAFGFRAKPGKPFRIWIKNVNTRQIDSQLYLSTYEEWHEVEGEAKGRLSTAIFRLNANTTNGIEWLHAHETWLPEG